MATRAEVVRREPSSWTGRLGYLSAAALLVALVGCGGGGRAEAPPPAPLPDPVAVPPGVDSIVALVADSIADASLVDEAAEDEAAALRDDATAAVQRTDSLWLALTAAIDRRGPVSAEDSAAADIAATDGGLALLELDGLLQTDDGEQTELVRRTAALLDSAELALERSFRLNPFDTRSRLWLARVYELQARRLGRMEAHERAVSVLEKLTLVTPDQHTVFALLANNQFYLDDWIGAARSYATAEDVYMSTRDLVIEQPEPLDSALVHSYARAQGDMHVHARAAAPARAAYERAASFAPTEEDRAYLAGELGWLAWDDDNIGSSLARDSLMELEQEGQLAQARAGYLGLVDRLTARSAIDETQWRIAIVDYGLDRADSAVVRLQQLVERTQTDEGGAPIDTTYVRYFEDYGTLCMNLGRAARSEQRDRRTAIKYFTQASRLTWSGRGVAHLEIARLVQGNVDLGLESARAALAVEETLDSRQKAELYRLLMELHRRVGDFDQARAFRDAYRTLRGG